MKGKEAVVMKDVRKEFTGKKQRKVAVDGLSVTLYEDHITAFLGHNGAGIYFLKNKKESRKEKGK